MVDLFAPGNTIGAWVEPRRNALLSAAAGLAGSGVQGLLSGAQAGMAYDDKLAKEAKQTNATREWLTQAGYDDLLGLVDAGQADVAFSEALKRQQPGYGAGPTNSITENANARAALADQYGLAGDDRTNFILSGELPSARGAAGEVGLQTIPLLGPNGQYATGQPSKSGDIVLSAYPEGYTPVSPYDLSAQKAGGTSFGKNTGGAQFDLPAARLSAEQTLKAIQDVRAQSDGMDEQFGNILGVPQQVTPAWPGSNKANFQVANARLTNRAFLEAREVLRGGGQITDFESRKAEGAITNIEDAIARGDKALYEQALNDFEQAVRDGLAKLEAQASAMPGYGQGGRASGGAAAPAGNVDDLLDKYR